MGGLTGAVHWWEGSQLRVLVLTSLVIQFFLFFFPVLRRLALPDWLRFMMWLAYHGGDAVAIYALAMLFNRHKDQGDGSVGGGGSSNTLLEVVWAPVLLIHLGGHDGVTAYNIEDNELWSRHLLTTVSQVTVAIYVFSKSWQPGGDKMLLLTAILLFEVGVVKCFYKAWAFKRASIYSLVSSTDTAANQTNDDSMYYKLEKYVKDARDIVIRQEPEEDHAGVMMTSQTSKLFVDLSSSYPHRIIIFEEFWGLIVREEETAYHSVQEGLASAFFLLYTKLKAATRSENSYTHLYGWEAVIQSCIQYLRFLIPWACIALFHHSHREAYNGIDVKVTYAILCCTAVLEAHSLKVLVVARVDMGSTEGVWPETVAQYSLSGYFVRNKKHSIKMGIVSFLQCKDFLDQHWYMEPCFTSARITSLVVQYLKDGWDQKIQDAATYRSFNNHSSWSLNMNRPFDECVLLWHLATDFCFFSSNSFPDHKCAFSESSWVTLCREIQEAGKSTSFAKNPTGTTGRPECSQESAKCKAVQCRQMSNYMVYLLFVNPDMLLPGSRRNLFKKAYDELKGILKNWEWKPVCRSWRASCGDELIKEETTVMKELITVMKNKPVMEIAITVTQRNLERSSQEGSSMEGSNRDKKFVDQAWDLAQRLLEKDEMERWKEIQDVWVQMLCYSASRCRGYLHAKALGKGGEFLSYVWLLLFYMGMETFTDKLQREDLLSHESGNQAGIAPPLTSEVSTTGAGAPSASEGLHQRHHQRRHSTSF